jgi:citrate lyase subunit beta/citryl-CoA lyase
MIARLLNDPANAHKRAGVRIHDPSHAAYKQDIDILVGESGGNIAYITVPKVTSHAQAADAVELIHDSSLKAGLTTPPPVHVIIETQSGLRDVFEIASLAGLQGIVFGLLDFVSDHRGAIPASAMRSPGQFRHHLITRAKTEITAAALANGLVPTHNPCLVFNDPASPREDARIAHEEFGFLRMYSIHPAQIQPIVDAMQPSVVEVKRAAEILLAAQAADWGPVSHESEMHDRASYRYFWDVLKRARATGVEVTTAAENAFFPREFPTLADPAKLEF